MRNLYRLAIKTNIERLQLTKQFNNYIKKLKLYDVVS